MCLLLLLHLCYGSKRLQATAGLRVQFLRASHFGGNHVRPTTMHQAQRATSPNPTHPHRAALAPAAIPGPPPRSKGPHRSPGAVGRLGPMFASGRHGMTPNSKSSIPDLVSFKEASGSFPHSLLSTSKNLRFQTSGSLCFLPVGLVLKEGPIWNFETNPSENMCLNKPAVSLPLWACHSASPDPPVSILATGTQQIGGFPSVSF